eukprot:TRINITY_DN4270_c5_g1_i1.p1 TRINITY_DN4270_c5_g1~~TRINITY_DN4270_c5_g1_i1.p1  ORF type:complete len:354 (+),score=37.67 TRINITY_DN4270_c5_g1_i1:193-1254(+)
MAINDMTDVDQRIRFLRQQLMYMKKKDRRYHKPKKDDLSNPFDLIKGEASIILDQIYSARETTPKRFDLTKFIKPKTITETSELSRSPSPRPDRGKNARPWRERPEGLRPLPRIIAPSPEPPVSPVSERPWRERPAGFRETESPVTNYLSTMDGKFLPNPQAYSPGTVSRCPKRHILVPARVEGEMDVFLVGGRSVCSICKERTPILTCSTCCPHYYMCRSCSVSVDKPTASEMAPIITSFDKIVSRTLSPSNGGRSRRVSNASSRGSRCSGGVTKKLSINQEETSPRSNNSSNPSKKSDPPSDPPVKPRSSNLGDLFDSDEEPPPVPQYNYNVEPEAPDSPAVSIGDLSDCG